MFREEEKSKLLRQFRQSLDPDAPWVGFYTFGEIGPVAEHIKQELGGDRPKLVFQFDCASRGKMMFREEEKSKLLRQFRQCLDPDAPWVGFYTFGEIGPVADHNLRHLYTAVVLALK